MAYRNINAPARRFRAALGILLPVIACACATIAAGPGSADDIVVISIMGTNDVHGELSPQPGRGGLTTISGYAAALRAVRAGDGGGVLLVDAGDMWQGTLESYLSEGASVVDAYNALGYAAAAIGNHEFDFGPVGELATPDGDADDPRGALKLRAMEAKFPLLAANLIDTSTNQPVAWQNVRPSMMIEVAGMKIGIVGVITENALQTTIAANTIGLRVAPLAEAIEREARLLRAAGATLLIVLSHAGGRCEEFGDPYDLSSCDLSREIMRVANELPVGLVDHIVAGHVHRGIAHIVNGIAITSSYSSTRAFSRVDFLLDRQTGKVRDRIIYPPQPACGFVNRKTGQCIWIDDGSGWAIAARYEGRRVVPTKSIAAIVNRAAAQSRERKMQKLGVFLETPITLEGKHRSPLGHLVTDAMLDSSDADVAIYNVTGGIRGILPPGELTFGSLFNMLPFDNRLVVLDLTGGELRRIIAHQVGNQRRRAAFSGMQVFVDCNDSHMSVTMSLPNGHDIQDGDSVSVVVNDFLALGGDDIVTPVMPDGGFLITDDLAMIRDAVGTWLSARGGRLRADQFLDTDNPRWNLPDHVPARCSL